MGKTGGSSMTLNLSLSEKIHNDRYKVKINIDIDIKKLGNLLIKLSDIS